MKAVLNLGVSKWTINRFLNSHSYLKYRKMKKRLALTPTIVQNRLLWAEFHVHWTSKWKNVIFSDEKKFNLDGPDSLHYYWHDMRKDVQYYTKTVNDRRSVMVWAAFSWCQRSELVVIDGTMDANYYMRIMNEYLLPMLKAESIYQQDNASPHVAHVTRSWFLFRGIKLLTWPARSPDLNPMENIWGLLVRRVYRNNTTYNSKMDLISALKREWSEIDHGLDQTLVSGMPKRCVQLLKKNGRSINY